MILKSLKFPLFLLTVSALSGLGQSAQAQNVQAQSVQLCQDDDFPSRAGEFPKAYVQIQTSGDPLRVRASPAGQQIGLIPNGWNVRVLEWSRNGYWVKVTSQYGSWDNRMGFGNAPDFAEGWVSAGYVRDMGRSCQKPGATAQLLRPAVFGLRPVEVQSDWLLMGDMLAARVAGG